MRVRDNLQLESDEYVLYLRTVPIARGRIEVGNYADLVLFDPEKIADRSTMDDPTAVSVGVTVCWVGPQSHLVGVDQPIEVGVLTIVSQRGAVCSEASRPIFDEDTNEKRGAATLERQIPIKAIRDKTFRKAGVRQEVVWVLRIDRIPITTSIESFGGGLLPVA